MRFFLACFVVFLCSFSVSAQHWQEAFEKAQVAFENGDLQKAGTFGIEALEVANQRHGKHSNEAINTLNLLVQSYLSQGDLNKAIWYSGQLLTALEKSLGKENQYYTQVVLSLGNLLLQDHQYNRSLKLYESNKETIEKLFAADNPDYGYFVADLAFLSLNDGNEAEALKNYRLSIQVLEQADEDPYFIAENIKNSRKLLVKKEEHEEIIKFGRKLMLYNKELPVEEQVINLIDIAAAYQHQKRYDSAEYFLISAKSYFDNNKIKKDGQFSFIVNQLGYINSVAGSNEKSAGYLQEEGSAGEDKTSLFNQAIIAQNNGRLEDASQFYAKLFLLEKENKLDDKDQVLLYDYFSLYSIKTNDPENATEYNSKALAAGRKAYGKKSSNYLQLIAHQALVEKSFGNYIKARDIYEGLIKDIENSELTRTRLYIDVMSHYAINMQHLNDFQKAKIYCEKAVEMALSIGYKKDNLAVLFNNYAVMLQLAGDYFLAEEYQVKALQLVRDSYGDQHSNYVYNMVNLGEIYIKQGNFNKADSVFNHSKSLMAGLFGKESPESAMVTINATKVDKELGRYARADNSYLSALKILQNAGPAYKLEFAYALNDYGLLLKVFGNYKAAEKNIKEAAIIFKQLLGKSSADYGSSLGNLANLYQLQDKDNEAEKYLKEVLIIDKQLYGRLHPKYSTTLHNLASLYQKQEQVEKAINLYSEALEIDSIIHGTSHHAYANTLYNLADLYDSKGEYEKALKTYEHVLEVTEAVYGNGNPEYTYRLYGLARLHQRLRNNEKALELYREISNSYLFQVREYFPVLSEDEKALFYAKINPVINSFRELLLNMYKDDASLAGEFFNLQLHTKAILLNASNRLRKEISNSKDKNVVMLYDQLIQKKNKLLNYYNYSKADLMNEGVDIQQLEDELNILEKELSQKFDLFTEVYDLNSLSWKDVKSALGNEEVVVEIIRITEAMEDNKVSYAALVLAKDFDQPKMVVLKHGVELEEKGYNFYRNALAYEIIDSTSFKLFWKPVHQLTKSYKVAYVSPDGVFNKLNLNTLFNGKEYLIENQLISFISSTKDFTKKNKKIKNNGQTADLFGYPVFNVDRSAMTSPEQVNRLYEEWMTNIDLLPGTRVEVDNIESTLNMHKWSIAKHVELNASEENIKRLQSPTVLHIATHGYFSEDINFDVNAWKEQDKTEEYDFNPLLRSGILLSKAESTVRKRLQGVAINTEDDGILTAYEAMNLNLSGTDLVILSACETGLGEVKNGEGIYGLQRAFMVSGAKNIIMSLWKVDDQATQELMSRFYRHWLVSADLHSSLRKAQLEIKEEFGNPSLWGGFILNGL